MFVLAAVLKPFFCWVTLQRWLLPCPECAREWEQFQLSDIVPRMLKSVPTKMSPLPEKTARHLFGSHPKKGNKIVFRPLFMCKGFMIWSIYQSNISLKFIKCKVGVNHEMVPLCTFHSPISTMTSTWQVDPPVPRVTRWEFVLKFQDWTFEKSNDFNSWEQRGFLWNGWCSAFRQPGGSKFGEKNIYYIYISKSQVVCW